MAGHAAGGNDSFAVSGINPFNFVFGHAGANMSASAAGGNDTFDDSSDATLADRNVFSGDAGGNMSGSAHGGDDTFNKTGLGGSTFYGEAAGDMSGRAQGGNDTFQASGTQNQNLFYGDAGGNMGDQAVGGDDTYFGGNVFSQLINQAYGDASTMSGRAHGGNDTLVGGNDPNPHAVGSYETILVGDAQSMSDYARGGNDRLVSGTGNDDIWGDAQMMLGFAQGGNDTFVFDFDNGHDKVEDFGQGLSNQGADHIDVSALGIENFSDLSFSPFDPVTHESTVTSVQATTWWCIASKHSDLRILSSRHIKTVCWPEPSLKTARTLDIHSASCLLQGARLSGYGRSQTAFGPIPSCCIVFRVDTRS